MVVDNKQGSQKKIYNDYQTYIVTYQSLSRIIISIENIYFVSDEKSDEDLSKKNLWSEFFEKKQFILK